MKKCRHLWLTICLMILLPACTAAWSESPSQGLTWQEQYDLGARYLSEGNYEEAILAFTAAIEIDPKQAPAYVGRGDAYMLFGETEDNLAAAQVDYEVAIELDEADAQAYLGLAEVYVHRGDYDKALEIIRRGIEKASGDSRLVEQADMLEDRVATDVVAVVLNHESLWNEPFDPEMKFSYGVFDSESYRIYFLDMDFDGVQELIVESPMMGSGMYTNRYIYRISGQELEEVENPYGYSTGWDEISLMRDKLTKEYFYVGYDYVREGVFWGLETWERFQMLHGEIQSTILYVRSQEDGVMTYFDSANNEISEGDFNRLQEELQGSADDIEDYLGTVISDWDISAPQEEKQALLLAAYRTAPQFSAGEFQMNNRETED